MGNSNNSNLNRSKVYKNDEFYTVISDIESEVYNYRDYFAGKSVYCNCDDPATSKFWEFFHVHFSEFGITKLTSTFYSEDRNTYRFEYTGGNDSNITCGTRYDLYGNGDFRNTNCIKLLQDHDIIVTNPPFSLFHDYIEILVYYKKSFLFLGNMNAVTYRDFFPLLNNGTVWFGVNSGEMSFTVPDSEKPRKTRFWIDDTGQKWRSIGNSCWFTNIDHNRHHELFTSTAKYDPTKYRMYDDGSALNVDHLEDIPMDYDLPMGVPITFLAKHNPDQFTILGLANSSGYIGNFKCITRIDGEKVYNRVIIQKVK